MNEKFLNVREVASRFGVSVSTIWRWAADENIPAPIKLGVQTTRWRESEINKHLQNLGANNV